MSIIASGSCDVEWQTDESAVPCSTEYILLTLHYVSIYVTKKGHPTVSVCVCARACISVWCVAYHNFLL